MDGQFLPLMRKPTHETTVLPLSLSSFFPILLIRSATLFSSSPLCRESTLEETLGVCSIFFTTTFENTTKPTLSFSPLGTEISCCQILFIERKFTEKNRHHLKSNLTTQLLHPFSLYLKFCYLKIIT